MRGLLPRMGEEEQFVNDGTVCWRVLEIEMFSANVDLTAALIYTDSGQNGNR
jgi:hypothetical protein